MLYFWAILTWNFHSARALRCYIQIVNDKVDGLGWKTKGYAYSNYQDHVSNKPPNNFDGPTRSG